MHGSVVARRVDFSKLGSGIGAQIAAYLAREGNSSNLASDKQRKRGLSLERWCVRDKYGQGRYPFRVKLDVLIVGQTLPVYPRSTDILRSSGMSQRCHARTSSNLAAGAANARGRNATFPSLRPVLADQCRSPQGCLPTMRVQLREYSSAPGFRARSHRYG